MAVTDSTYYALTRVREASPESQNWATTDLNWDIISRILKNFEQHSHTGISGLEYPGYDPLDISNPTLVTLTEQSTGGFLTPGTTVGVRISYINAAGLETKAGPEIIVDLAPAVERPLTPQLSDGWPRGKSISPVIEGDLAGGTYVYGITKSRGSSETTLSDLLPVDVPYDNTYQIEITFDSIESYTNLVRTGNLSNNSNVISSINTDGVSTGMVVDDSGSFIPADTVVTAVDSNLGTVTMSKNATGTVASSLVFNDGTESLNIYRSEGLDSAFTLVDKILNTSQTTYVDTGGYETSLVGVQPPATSTFDATKAVRISWSAIEADGIPAEAKKLRIYVTQEAHLWGETHLLKEIDLATFQDSFVDYTGVEDLMDGWPKDSTQVVSASPKIDLSNEVTGTLTLDSDMNFANFKAKNIRLDTNAGGLSGQLWYSSTSGGQLILRGESGNIQLAQAGAGYTHPEEESGGHNSHNIRARSDNNASTTAAGNQNISTSAFNLTVGSTASFTPSGSLLVTDGTGVPRQITYFSKNANGIRFDTCIATADVSIEDGATVVQGIRVYDIFRKFYDTTTLSSKQVQTVKSIEGPDTNSISTTSNQLTVMRRSDGVDVMKVSDIKPAFVNQWCRINWDGTFQNFSEDMETITFDILVEEFFVGSLVADYSSQDYHQWQRFSQRGAYNIFTTGGEIWYQLPNPLFTYNISLRWATTNGELIAVYGHRRLTAQTIF